MEKPFGGNPTCQCRTRLSVAMRLIGSRSRTHHGFNNCRFSNESHESKHFACLIRTVLLCTVWFDELPCLGCRDPSKKYVPQPRAPPRRGQDPCRQLWPRCSPAFWGPASALRPTLGGAAGAWPRYVPIVSANLNNHTA